VKKKGDIVSAYPSLREALHHESREIRWKAAEILTTCMHSGEYNLKIYGDAIIKLKNGTDQEKIDATRWLVGIATPDLVSDRDERYIDWAVPSLAAALSDDNQEVVVGAIKALRAALSEKQDIYDAIPSAIKVLQSSGDEERKAASFLIQQAALAKLDLSDFVPRLQPLLSSEFEPVKFGVTDSLAIFFGIKENWHELRKLLFHADKDVRQEAAGSIAQGYDIKVKKVLPELKKLLEDDEEDVRLVAAMTISTKIYDNENKVEAMPVLMAALEHDDDEHRGYASAAIKSIFTTFFNNLHDEAYTSETSAVIPEGYWKSLEEYIPILEEKLQDKNSKVKLRVAQLLSSYYLRTNEPEKIIKILGGLSAKNQKEVHKSLEWDNWEKPREVVMFIARGDNEALAKKIKREAKKKPKSFSISGQSIGAKRYYELPPEIRYMTDIKDLNIDHNLLEKLPKEIGYLTSLEQLHATQNHLESLPREIGNLINLKQIFLYRNKLKSLPAEFGNLVNLNYLQLSQNELEELPPEFGKLTSLTYLTLEQNKLKELPIEFCNINNLGYLDLRNNSLSNLPEGFENLKNIYSLQLDNNEFNKIPESIFELTNLTYLSLSGNKIKELSPEIGNLKKLDSLYISSNKIKEIPKEIGKLRELRILYIRYNEIEALPREMTKMRKLQFLELDGNKKLDEEVPAGHLIGGRGVPKFFRHYFKDE
ncbi:MAG: leucine-rich repeat domain-containing protein, partial [Candidatus Hodarchaeota archaeon]